MKKIAALLSSIATYFAVAVPAFAQGEEIRPCPEGSDFQALCNLSQANIGEIIQWVIILLLIFAVVISIIFLIWGGIKWILSGGDKGAVEAARNRIIAALVGLIIAFVAFFLVNVVFQIFTGETLNFMTIPSIPRG